MCAGWRACRAGARHQPLLARPGASRVPAESAAVAPALSVVRAGVRACVRVHVRACVRACACMCMCLFMRACFCAMIAMQRGFIRDCINGTVRKIRILQSESLPCPSRINLKSPCGHLNARPDSATTRHGMQRRRSGRRRGYSSQPGRRSGTAGPAIVPWAGSDSLDSLAVTVAGRCHGPLTVTRRRPRSGWPRSPGVTVTVT